MPFYVPSEDPDLIEVEGQTIFGFSEDGEILRHFLVSVLHLIKNKEGDDALAFGVLGDIERHINVDHAREDPTYATLAIAN